MRILILNGSLGGDGGNTQGMLDSFRAYLPRDAQVDTVFLRDARHAEELRPRLDTADGFVFATGTYWDSWGSPLQRFLEEATVFEGSSIWLGKPAAALISMHAVGGKAVLSRLQGVLSTVGCLVPPMGGLVYSLANQLALAAPASSHQDDLWRLADLEVVAHNLCEAIRGGRSWRTWSVDADDPGRRWFAEETGPLDCARGPKA